MVRWCEPDPFVTLHDTKILQYEVIDMNGLSEDGLNRIETLTKAVNVDEPFFDRSRTGGVKKTPYIAWGPVNYSVDEFCYLLMRDSEPKSQEHDHET